MINADRYAEKYRAAIDTPEAFWREESARLDWIKPWTRLGKCSFDEADFGIEWFSDGTLNVSANCLDRHLATRGDKAAILWEPDDPTQTAQRITYRGTDKGLTANISLLDGSRPVAYAWERCKD